MNNYIKLLSQNELFKNIKINDLESILSCLPANITKYQKKEYLLLAGDKPDYVGILLEGSLQVIKEDYQGNRTILTTIEPGDFFAETITCANVKESPVSVVAQSNSVVMQINFNQIIATCTSDCDFKLTLITNMLGIIAKKSLFLQNRMNIISVRSIREKVLRYFDSLNVEVNKEFTIPLNREKMAEYLSVDRSALSHELMKMKQEGLIEYKRNTFILK